MHHQRLVPLAEGANQSSNDAGIERRRTWRTLTVLRAVKVQSVHEEGLARLQNVSDDGMMLRLKIPVGIGEPLTVYLSEDEHVTAEVVWVDGEKCGIKLMHRIDSAELLARLAQRPRYGSTRPIRMAVAASGIVYSQAGIHPVRVRDVSQKGMKIEHRCGFTAGLRVKIQLESGLQRRGVVRWSQGELAGIELLESIGLDRLGSSRNL